MVGWPVVALAALMAVQFHRLSAFTRPTGQIWSACLSAAEPGAGYGSGGGASADRRPMDATPRTVFDRSGVGDFVIAWTRGDLFLGGRSWRSMGSTWHYPGRCSAGSGGSHNRAACLNCSCYAISLCRSPTEPAAFFNATGWLGRRPARADPVEFMRSRDPWTFYSTQSKGE